MINPHEFDRYDQTYEQEMEKSIGFCTTDHAFFIEAKTRILIELADKYVGNIANLNLLDIGCGLGNTSKILSRDCRRIVGVDISEKMIAMAAAQLPHGEFREFDGANIPYGNDQFDVVFAMNVFHHISPQQRDPLLADMVRVLKPGGAIMIFEHNPYNPFTLKAVRQCSFDADAILLKSTESCERLRYAGLSRVFRRFVIFIPFDGWLHRITTRWLGWLPLGAQYVAMGVKKSGGKS